MHTEIDKTESTKSSKTTCFRINKRIPLTFIQNDPLSNVTIDSCLFHTFAVKVGTFPYCDILSI